MGSPKRARARNSPSRRSALKANGAAPASAWARLAASAARCWASPPLHGRTRAASSASRFSRAAADTSSSRLPSWPRATVAAPRPDMDASMRSIRAASAARIATASAFISSAVRRPDFGTNAAAPAAAPSPAAAVAPRLGGDMSPPLPLPPSPSGVSWRAPLPLRGGDMSPSESPGSGVSCRAPRLGGDMSPLESPGSGVSCRALRLGGDMSPSESPGSGVS
mmetsp:Transcript_9977/g.41336  ORF Transcript_9977/g.41336 Transcript_9977/m.41336 type:complete len:222 (+) Transcript_9977:334-999(+)